MIASHFVEYGSFTLKCVRDNRDCDFLNFLLRANSQNATETKTWESKYCK